MNTMTLLQDAAVWAWHTSMVVAVPGLILLALGRWRSFPARWRMLFAAVLLLRLLLPAVPEFSWHPVASLEHTLVISPAAPAVHDNADAAFTDEAITPVATTTARSPSWKSIAASIWALGVVFVAGWLVTSHWLIRRWVAHHAGEADAHVAQLFEWSCERMGIRRRIGLAEMPRLATAAVCGWLRPIVLLPANLRQTHSDDEIRGILLHELAHVRRCDVLWSWLGLAACALHWFNPLAWLALRRFHTDRELDCDRMALAELTATQRNAYAPALFKMLECPPCTVPAALAPFFRHKHEIHARILTIMKPTTSLLATFAALLVIPALSILTLTTARADEEKPTDKPAAPDIPVAGKPAEETAVKRGDGERDSKTARRGPRDGEGTRKSAERDGEGTRKSAERDGDGASKTGSRDGETPRTGSRDGEVRKTGPRDGEGSRATGPRDGEGTRRTGARDGEGMKRSDSDRAKDETVGNDQAVVLRVLATGESVAVNGETVPTNRLRGYLSGHLPAHRGAAVFIEAEDNVPHKAVMEVLDAAKDNGAKNASIRAITR